MKLFIKAYPKYTYIVSCSSGLSDVKNLSRALLRRQAAIESSLCLSDSGYYLCAKVEVDRIPSQIGDICEHSDRVFIGKDYYLAVREHMTQVIKASAVEKLS